MMRWYHWRLALSCWNWVPRALPPGSKHDSTPEFNKCACYPTNGDKGNLSISDPQTNSEQMRSWFGYTLFAKCMKGSYIQLVLNWALWSSTTSKRNSITTLYIALPLQRETALPPYTCCQLTILTPPQFCFTGHFRDGQTGISNSENQYLKFS